MNLLATLKDKSMRTTFYSTTQAHLVKPATGGPQPTRSSLESFSKFLMSSGKGEWLWLRAKATANVL